MDAEAAYSVKWQGLGVGVIYREWSRWASLAVSANWMEKENVPDKTLEQNCECHQYLLGI